MSYRILYGGEPKQVKKNTSYFGIIGVGLIVTVWLLAFGWFLPQQAQKFREVFFPWSSSEVRVAVANLREDVRNGLPFQEAVQTFCRELMNEAGE